MRTLNESGITVILDDILTEDNQELFDQVKVFGNCFVNMSRSMYIYRK